MLKILTWMNLVLWILVDLCFAYVVLTDKRKERMAKATIEETWDQHVDEALSLQE